MRENRHFCFSDLLQVDWAAEYLAFASDPGALSRGSVDKKRCHVDRVGGNWFRCSVDSGQLRVGRADSGGFTSD